MTMQLTKGKCGLGTILVLVAVALCAASTGCGSGSVASTRTATTTPTPTPTPTPIPTPTPTPTPSNPAPGLTTIAPNSAPAGALAFTLTVSGSNFLPASQVEWEGSSRTTTFVSSTQLQAHIMAADLAAAGKVPVTVVNPAPGGGSSNAVTFTVPAATIAFQSVRALDGSDALNTNSIQNIWTMNPDGSGAVPLSRLTAANTDASNPVWSPDGSKIAYESTRALDGSDALNTNSTSNIWVTDADGSNPKPLTRITAFGGDSSHPKWSPDGSKIAYQSPRALDGSDASIRNFNIWVVNADGSGATPLTRITTLFTPSQYPEFSPDGSKVVFYSSRALDGSDAANTALNIWLMNADGSGATPLTRVTFGGAGNVTPVFSPDGSKIAFSSRRALDGSDAMNTNDTDNIWTINRDGTQAAPVTRFTAFLAGAEFPAWSPDGSKIAFFSSHALDGSDAQTPNDTYNIWTVQADGTSAIPLTKLTASQANAFFPKWLPDGSKLIFESTRAFDGGNAVSTNGTFNIWTVNADGSGATPLTRLTNAPSRSPDIP